MPKARNKKGVLKKVFRLVFSTRSLVQKMFKKLISYIYPLTTKIQSKFSGKLELTVFNGRKVLDTKNTNYSYGSLQRVLKYSLDQLDMSHIKSALVLGLGGGSVIQTLREDKHFEGKITAVEIDPVIIDIAANEFNITDNENSNIVCDDAWNFVLTDPVKYDLIIVDLFIDNAIPDKFLETEFWKGVLNHLNKGGDVIFNTLCHPKTDLTLLKEKLNRRKMSFEVHRYVEQSNKVLIAHYNNVA
jgi:spermidine synthase